MGAFPKFVAETNHLSNTTGSRLVAIQKPGDEEWRQHFFKDVCKSGAHTLPVLSCLLGCSHTQDTSAGKHVAFKVTTKPLIVLEDDLPQPGIGSEAFNKNLQEQSWEYRCGIMH
eukprot:scaffold104231_cov17-Tisochrysis_lutea.AAC.1